MSNTNKNKLSLIYDKRQKDFVVKYPRSTDGHMLFRHFNSDILEWVMNTDEKSYPNNFNITNFIKDLEERGYDTTTLKFSVELKN